MQTIWQYFKNSAIYYIETIYPQLIFSFFVEILPLAFTGIFVKPQAPVPVSHFL